MPLCCPIGTPSFASMGHRLWRRPSATARRSGAWSWHGYHSVTLTPPLPTQPLFGSRRRWQRFLYPLHPLVSQAPPQVSQGASRTYSTPIPREHQEGTVGLTGTSSLLATLLSLIVEGDVKPPSSFPDRTPSPEASTPIQTFKQCDSTGCQDVRITSKTPS